MKRKFIVILVALLVLCAVIVTACKPDSTDPKDKDENPTLSNESLLALIQQIQRENSGITYTNETYTLTAVHSVNNSANVATSVYVKWTVEGSTEINVGSVTDGKVMVSVPAVRYSDIIYTLKATLTDDKNVDYTDVNGANYSAVFQRIAQKNEEQPLPPTMVTVTFAVNYSGGVNPKEKTVEQGTTIQLPEVSRTDYDFIGWYTASVNGSFVGDAGDDYVANSTLTLYAHWDEKQVSNENKTIVFYSTMGTNLSELADLVIAGFQAKYPDWTVIHETFSYDELYSKVKSDLQSNKQPDVAYCYADHVATYLTTGKVVDLANLIHSTATVDGELVGYTMAELDDFIPALLSEGIASNTYGNYWQYGYSDSSLLTLPMARSTEVMYYNKKALNDMGLQPATTWDELWAQCESIKQLYPDSTPFGYDSESNWFITMCKQNGWAYTSATDNHYLFNNANTTKWLAELKTLRDNGYATTMQLEGSYMSGLLNLGVENGGLMYAIGSTGGANNYIYSNYEIGVAPIPGSRHDDGSYDFSCISQGPSLVMFDNDSYDNASERELMTFLFVKELLDPVTQAIYTMASGYSPVRSSVYELPAFQEYLLEPTVVSQTLQVVTQLSDRLFTSPAFDGSATARQQVGNALVFAMSGVRTPNRALSEAYDNCVK
ncbi:MAG: extracellular solute-binding protein [Clostridiales bacterium]|nr:extracellular solute-binding protein [Clostridiales bacterium]